MTSRTYPITAFVPMKGESVRVPNKNIRLFNGKPLYHWIIQTLQQVPAISTIVIDTDSQVILEEARELFPAVTLYERPLSLRGNEVSMNKILLNLVKEFDSPVYLQTHSTNPNLKASTISAAINFFAENFDRHDSLFAVTKYKSRFWDSETNPINHKRNELLMTQNLSPIFEENSNLYIFKKNLMLAEENRIGNSPAVYELDRLESIDIDEERDFLFAEAVAKFKSLMEAKK